MSLKIEIEIKQVEERKLMFLNEEIIRELFNSFNKGNSRIVGIPGEGSIEFILKKKIVITANSQTWRKNWIYQFVKLIEQQITST